MKDIDLKMAEAARLGDIETMKSCKNHGATEFNWAMVEAAKYGKIEAMEWCKEWGATEFNFAMVEAARHGAPRATFSATVASEEAIPGYILAMKCCEEWSKQQQGAVKLKQ